MLLALALAAASVADWVPARWNSNDPVSLELLVSTPVNCLLLDERLWSAGFAQQAAEQGIVTLGIIRPGADPVASARQALAMKLTGAVLEGDFEPGAARRIAQLLSESEGITIELPPRGGVQIRGSKRVVGTCQGIWPGIRVQEKGAVKAQPTGGPWIETNAGFLRFVRAATDAPVWIEYAPPPGTVVPAGRYLQAIGDAASNGGRWIVALDTGLERRLLERDASALSVWKRITGHLSYFEEHKEWRAFHPHGQFALVQDADSGALLSGSLLDMVLVKHTPVRPVPRWKLSDAAMAGARMAVNADPEGLGEAEKEALRNVARSGGTLLSGPPGWKFPPVRKDQVTLGKEELDRLDEIWREVRSLVGRTNLGVRLFNVSGMLSNLTASPDGSTVALQLVNYTAYPVESVTAHVLGSWKRARLLSPDAPPEELAVYAIDEGTGVDIPEVRVCATLILDK